MRLSIATKIFLVFTALVTLFTGVLMFGTYRTDTLYSDIQRLNQTVVPISLVLSDVQTDLKSFNVVLNERDPLVLRRTMQMTRLVDFLPDRVPQNLKRAQQLAAEAQDLPQAGALQKQLADLQEDALDFSQKAGRFNRLVLGDKPSEDPAESAEPRNKLQLELAAEARQLDQEITSLRNDLRARTDMALNRANERQRSSLYTLVALSALALLIAAGLLVTVMLTLRPLNTLTWAARRIGQGDYSPIEGIKEDTRGSDEIILLAREFNSMAQSLAERDQRLREQHERLLKSERMATVGRMTSLITHELRNPLSSINLNSEMLLDILLERGISADDQEVLPLLDTIIAEVDRLRDITEEYLVYARLPTPNLAPVRLLDIIENLLDFHQFEWAQSGVEVKLETPQSSPDSAEEGSPADPRGPEVMADANQMRQALLNLIRNAVEASPSGAEVLIRINRQGAQALVEVQDQGEGISAEKTPHIFDPFFTSKPQGTGLGLAMTQEIIEEHFGSISAYSTPGEGARFVIKLPLRASPQTDQGSP